MNNKYNEFRYVTGLDENHRLAKVILMMHIAQEVSLICG